MHRKAYERFFTMKETPKRGRKVSWTKRPCDKYVGYWILVTNVEIEAGKATRQYRKHDQVGKQFAAMKHLLEGDRLRTKGPIAMESIGFFKFLSLIITKQMRKILRNSPSIRRPDPLLH